MKVFKGKIYRCGLCGKATHSDGSHINIWTKELELRHKNKEPALKTDCGCRAMWEKFIEASKAVYGKPQGNHIVVGSQLAQELKKMGL